jgi:hypothetical protein
MAVITVVENLHRLTSHAILVKMDPVLGEGGYGCERGGVKLGYVVLRLTLGLGV